MAGVIAKAGEPVTFGRRWAAPSCHSSAYCLFQLECEISNFAVVSLSWLHLETVSGVLLCGDMTQYSDFNTHVKRQGLLFRQSLTAVDEHWNDVCRMIQTAITLAM